MQSSAQIGSAAGAGAADVADPDNDLSSVPLTPEAHGRASTRFVLLGPEVTGISAENRYADPRIQGELFREFDTSSIGSGVAIGDFDGDGRPDVFVVRKSDSCRLFHNLGNWKFEDVTDRAGLAETPEAAAVWKQGAAFADVNNDGRPDLYVCRFGAPNLLFINQGGGLFKEEAAARGLAVTDSSVMAAFSDYDHDGWLDLYITTNILDVAASPEGQAGYLFRNKGDGTFIDVTKAAGISGIGQSHSATWWDYDDDGWADLYVANDYGVPDRLYRNNRDGTFEEVIGEALPHTAFSAMGADVGDVNNDGLVDLLVADMAATTHEADQRFLADSRSKAEDHDGPQKLHRNALLLGTGTAHLREAANLAGVAATDWTWSVRFEDLDNDGRLDLFVTNGFHRTPSVDLIRSLTKASSADERRRIMLASPEQTEANIALRNLGDLQFQSVGADWGLDQKGISFGAAFGDLDGDGDLDLVYTNYRGDVSVLRNDSAPRHRVIFDLRGRDSNRFGVDAKVTLETKAGKQTRVLTLARGYLSTSEPMLHFGLGDETVINRVTVRWSRGGTQVFENLPADRRYLIRENPSEKSASVSRGGTAHARKESGRIVEPMFMKETPIALRQAVSEEEEEVDETAGQPLLPLRLNRRGPALALAPVTPGPTNLPATPGKAHEPVPPGLPQRLLAMGGTSRTPARLLKVETSGEIVDFQPALTLPLAKQNDGPLAWLDVNGDGLDDLLVTRGGNKGSLGEGDYRPRLYLRTGDSRIEEAETGLLPGYSGSVGAVAVGDFNKDGRPDVFVGARLVPGDYPTPPDSALWQNRDGKLVDVTAALAPALRKVGLVTAALWADVDGDGWQDLVVALDWGGIRLFHNAGGQALEDWTTRAGFERAGTGWWRALAVADFNGDGRPDFVLGNVGLNTQYQADGDRPALLFAGHFRGDSSTQLVEAHYEGENVYPWRTRDVLGASLPWISRRFPRNENYARATLPQVVGEEKLRAATRLAATELRSGILLSQADGVYRFEPLPRIAQIAPAEAIAAADFDGDGQLDIFLAQNSSAPVATIGRFDGGLGQLLRGDGAGHFEEVPPKASGLVVPGDAKSAVAADLNGDGRIDLLVSQNNNAVLFFNNHGVAKSVPLAGRRARK